MLIFPDKTGKDPEPAAEEARDNDGQSSA